MKVCANCKHVKFGDLMGLKTAYCGFNESDDFIVPHNSELENGRRGDDSVITFTRIPVNCPLPDTIKSESPANECDWITLTIPK